MVKGYTEGDTRMKQYFVGAAFLLCVGFSNLSAFNCVRAFYGAWAGGMVGLTCAADKKYDTRVGALASVTAHFIGGVGLGVASGFVTSRTVATAFRATRVMYASRSR